MSNTWRCNFILLSTNLLYFNIFPSSFFSFCGYCDWNTEPCNDTGHFIQSSTFCNTQCPWSRAGLVMFPGWGLTPEWHPAPAQVSGSAPGPPMFLLLRAWPLLPLEPPGPANMLAQLPVLRVSHQPEPEPKGSSATYSTDLSNTSGNFF